MSLNIRSRDSSHAPSQRETLTSTSSRVDNPQPHEDQDPADPVTSPHATTIEHTTPAAKAHDITAPPQHQAFQPFFTLVEDQQTGEYYHPTVHYIFSDDDTDIITAAALRSLEAQQDALSGSKKEQLHKEDTEPLDEEKHALLPPPIPGVRDNYLVLDVEPVPAVENTTTAVTGTSPISGDVNAGLGAQLSTSPGRPVSLAGGTGTVTSQPQFRVTAAKSFSPTWQVLQSEMVPAPTFENNEASEASGHGLMLKIHGTSGLPYVAKSNKENGAQRLEEMMDQFAKRMSELQTVIDSVEVDQQNAPEAEGEERQGQGEHDTKKEKEGGEPADTTDEASHKEETVENSATGERE